MLNMPTKDQLRTNTLMERGLTRSTNPVSKHFQVRPSSVDKTPLMLYTEGITGLKIEQILVKQMSTRRLAEWITYQIARPITQATIVNWRKRFKIYRIKSR